MPTAISFTQNLPAILLAASIVLLSLFFLLSIRAKVQRQSERNNPRDFIRRTRESAVNAAAGLGLATGVELPTFRGGADYTKRSPSPDPTTTLGILPTPPSPASPASQSSSPVLPDPSSPVNSSATTAHFAAGAMDRQPTLEEVVELEATVRRLTAHLDTRAAVLAKLIRDADQRIEEVRAVVEHVPVASISPSKVSSAPQVEGSAEDSTDSSAEQPAPQMVGLNSQESLNRSIPPTPVVAGVRKTGEPKAPVDHEPAVVETVPRNKVMKMKQTADDNHSRPKRVVDPLAQSIYELSDRGLGAVTIAQDLDEHVGKVELILALRSA